MAFVKTLNRYAAFLYPNKTDTKARINLYCAESYKLYILFVDEDDLKPNSYNQTNKVGVAYVDEDHYAQYLDLIRNEKPVYVTFRPEDSPPSYVVYVANEEPGEGEM